MRLRRFILRLFLGIQFGFCLQIAMMALKPVSFFSLLLFIFNNVLLLQSLKIKNEEINFLVLSRVKTPKAQPRHQSVSGSDERSVGSVIV